MVHRFDLTPMKAFLKHRKEFFVIDDTKQYRRVTARLHGQGVVLRDEVYGSQLKTKEQQATKAGDLLVAEIDAKVGGVGIVPPELAGAVVSSHYFLYEIDEAVCHPKYLEYYIRSGAVEEQFQEFVRGSTNYASIRAHHTLELQMPLPPLDEQRRIVARIEELAALIEEAQGLRVKARKEAEALLFEAFQEFVDKGITNGWEIQPLSEVCEINPSRKKRTNYPDDMQVSFVPMSAVDDVTGSIVWPEVRSFSEVKSGYTWFLEGDVIFARITPCMQNGKSAIAKGLVNGVGFGSTEFHVLRPGQKVTAEWIHCIVRQPSFRCEAMASFKGSAGQQRVSQTFLEAYEVPIPTLGEQRRIVAYLDSLQAQVDELTALQGATQAELDALLPSVLDRAFRGEL
jgi:type I restriction enzyme S subunit